MREIEKTISIPVEGKPMDFRLTKLDAFSGASLLRMLSGMRKDPGNDSIMGFITFLSEPDLLKAIEDAKDFTVHCHIDNMGRGEHCHKLPWLGDIDLMAQGAVVVEAQHLAGLVVGGSAIAELPVARMAVGGIGDEGAAVGTGALRHNEVGASHSPPGHSQCQKKKETFHNA